MRLKKIGLFLLFILLIFYFSTPFQGEAEASNQLESIQVFINGEILPMDVEPVIIHGRTLVPFRAILEALGAQVHWSAPERKVSAWRQDISINLFIDNPTAFVQGEPVELDVPSRILEGRTLSPLRFVSETLGANVHWDGEHRRIYIYSPGPVSLSISPGSVYLLPRHTQTVSLESVFPPYQLREVKPERVSWSVEPGGIVEAKDNHITALRQGQATLTARYGELETKVQARVYPVSLERTTILSRDGYGEIELPEKKGPLQVKIEKGDKRYSFRTFPVEEERQLKITLPYGEGSYHVDISALEDGEWNEVQQYIIHNPQPVSTPEEYLYQRGAFNTTITQPTTNVDVLDSIRITGESDAEYFIFRIRHTDDLDNPKHFSHYFADGSIDAHVYLPLGKGLYHVTIFASSTYEGTYRNTWDFFVNNKGSKLKEDLIPTGEIQSDHPHIISLAEEITSNITREYNKSRAIHEWVTSNIAYDAGSLLNNSIRWHENTSLETLRRKEAVCTGYSNLTAALHRAVGIPAVVVEGIALNAGDNPVSRSAPGEPNHAWNEVFAEDRWLIMDTTWDAGYLDPQTKEFVQDPRRLYFDPHPILFSNTHTKIGKLEGAAK